NFDPRNLQWQWRLSDIKKAAITDNMVDLLVTRFENIPVATKHVLSLAACLGVTFDIKTLATLSEQSPVVVWRILGPAIQAGFIQSVSEMTTWDADDEDASLVGLGYRFVHDRVRQAAYGQMAEDQRKAVHLRIGRLLWSETDQGKQEERFFELVDHLNTSRDLITDNLELIGLAELNLSAGKRAKRSAAFDAALEYLLLGLACLPEDAWESQYNLTYALHQETAAAEYVNGRFEKAEELIHAAMHQVKSWPEQAELSVLLLHQDTMRGRYQEVIRTGAAVLAKIGLDLPQTDLPGAFRDELSRVKEKMATRSISSLADLPEITDETQKATVRVQAYMLTAASYLDQTLFGLLVLRIIDTYLEFGVVPELLVIFCAYGMVLKSALQEYRTGYEFGLLARHLVARNNDPFGKCITSHLLANFLSPWVRHLKESDRLNEESLQAGLESGELIYAGYSMAHRLHNSFFCGANLGTIINISDISKFLTKTGNVLGLNGVEGLRLAVSSLISPAENESDPVDYATIEELYLSKCNKNNSFSAIGFYLSVRSQVLYLYGRTVEALQSSFRATEFLPNMAGVFPIAEHNFYQSLILTALYLDAPEQVRGQYQGQLTANLRQMSLWADLCPDNFGHKFLLIQAEMARLKNDLTALELFDQAAAKARESGYIQDEALANELAARFWLSRNKPDIAGLYLKKAYYGYQAWGADGKARDLEKKYSQLLFRSAGRNVSAFKPDLTELKTYTVQDSDIFDMGAAMKASQAISGEIILPKLLTSLIRAIMANAGAERVFLILPFNDEWTITARALTGKDAGPVIPPVALAECRELSSAIVNYVARTGGMLVLNNAAQEGAFINDDYIIKHQSKSILCYPIKRSNRVTGLLYLENNLAVGAFTPGRLMALELLAAQAAISIQNARLYQDLEISERELAAVANELKQKNQELLANKTEMEELNQELLETNQALSLLIGNSEKRREESERRVALVVKSRIMPVVEELQQQLELAGYQSQFEMVTTYMNDLTARARSDKGMPFSLTPTELRIAIMIKNGFTSLKIANLLAISVDTVKTHRRNIRKKLNLTDERVNLATFLATKLMTT
ncbi:MAG: GAF domain-containing protein, partial [Deltaproteobacteria bacterium]|nr:GAF domain-containing protein [Deltaproteobacteria bacterium]